MQKKGRATRARCPCGIPQCSWSKIVVPISPGQDGIKEASPVPLPHALPLAKSSKSKILVRFGQPPLKK